MIVIFQNQVPINSKLNLKLFQIIIPKLNSSTKNQIIFKYFYTSLIKM